MAKYSYIAINTDGKQKQGTLDASSQQDANAQLNAKGLMPTKVILSEQGVAKASQASTKKNEKSFGLWARHQVRGVMYLYAAVGDFDSGRSAFA